MSLRRSSSAFVAWSHPVLGPRIASPILCQGCLYVFGQQGGTMNCLDAKTGKEHYRKRLPSAGGFTAGDTAAVTVTILGK